MSNSTIEERVIETVATFLGIKREEVHLNSRLTDDLGADSLDTIEVLMALEDEFGIEVPDEQAANFDSVQDYVTYMTAHVK